MQGSTGAIVAGVCIMGISLPAVFLSSGPSVLFAEHPNSACPSERLYLHVLRV